MKIVVPSREEERRESHNEQLQRTVIDKAPSHVRQVRGR